MEIIAEFFKTAWGWFCTHLSEALLVNAIVAFVFWVFGFLGRKIVVFFRGLIVRSRNKETKKGYRDSIISFDTVSPYYDSNLATMYLTPKRFVFEIPEEKRASDNGVKLITSNRSPIRDKQEPVPLLNIITCLRIRAFSCLRYNSEFFHITLPPVRKQPSTCRSFRP